MDEGKANLNFVNFSIPVISFFLSFFSTVLITPKIIEIIREAGFLEEDVHKPSKPKIPSMGGTSILAGVSIASVVSSILAPEFSTVLLVFMSVILIAGAVGIIDDIHNLNPIIKPALTSLASIPILLSHLYSEFPILPFIGRTKLTLIYPIVLFLFGISVPSNAINMFDVLNGAVTGSCIIVMLTFFICSILLNKPEVTILSAIMLGSLIACHMYTRYPAKTFLGDVGSLAIGASIGAIAVIGSIEIVAIIAILPHIMNAFYILTGIKKLSRHEYWPRPTKLLDDGRIIASEDPNAPITLVRMIVAEKPMNEPEIVKTLMMLTAFCCFLAFVTALLL